MMENIVCMSRWLVNGKVVGAVNYIYIYIYMSDCHVQYDILRAAHGVRHVTWKVVGAVNTAEMICAFDSLTIV